MPHSRIVTGSPRMAVTGVPTAGVSSTSTSSSLTFEIHCELSALRYLAVNGPSYAIAPAHTMVLPTTLRWPWLRRTHSCSQRVFSEPRPPTSLSARSSFTFVSASCSSSCLALRCVSSSFFLRPATRRSTSLSASCFSLSMACESASCFCAAKSFAFFGSTVLATRAYVSIARTHMQSDLAAVDTLPTISGRNFSFFMYFWMFLIFFSSMLSLS